MRMSLKLLTLFKQKMKNLINNGLPLVVVKAGEKMEEKRQVLPIMEIE